MDVTPHPDSRSRLAGLLLAAALSAPSLAGCQPAMNDSNSNPPPTAGAPDRKYTGTVADWPLFFLHHVFGAQCFDTLECKVLYAGFLHGSEEPTRSSASFGADYGALLRGVHVGIRNFPAPAIVTWRSMDGTELRAEVDVGSIFKDRLIRHNVAREDIPEQIGMGETHIILEVNDRTVSLYTRTWIPLKQPQDLGNPRSDFRDDLIKVYSRTY